MSFLGPWHFRTFWERFSNNCEAVHNPSVHISKHKILQEFLVYSPLFLTFYAAPFPSFFFFFISILSPLSWRSKVILLFCLMDEIPLDSSLQWYTDLQAYFSGQVHAAYRFLFSSESEVSGSSWFLVRKISFFFGNIQMVIRLVTMLTEFVIQASSLSP